jgi:hypothetical protein
MSFGFISQYTRRVVLHIRSANGERSEDLAQVLADPFDIEILIPGRLDMVKREIDRLVGKVNIEHYVVGSKVCANVIYAPKYQFEFESAIELFAGSVVKFSTLPIYSWVPEAKRGWCENSVADEPGR